MVFQSAMNALNLTQRPPRSPRVRLGGYAPARYERMNQWMVADTRVAIRQGPSDYSPRVATLRGGERFQAVGRVHHGEWIVVADRGAVIGYVPGDRVSPLGRAQYAWGY